MRAAIVLVLILGGLRTAEARCPASVTTDTFAARGSFAPMIASQNIVATSAHIRGWLYVKTLSSCPGKRKPVRLNANQAKQSIISQGPRMRGRKRDR